jgi:hypothetical protein
MGNSEQPTPLTRLLQTDLALIEVKNGESQEEAWKRHLDTNPATALARIKIFHYPAPRGGKTARGHRALADFRKRGEQDIG